MGRMQELEKMKAKAEEDLAKVEYLYVLYRYIFLNIVFTV